MDPSHQSLSLNPNSLNHRFAKGFLRALMRIQKHGHTKIISPSKASPREIAKRRCRVKMAADAAMASAVGRSRVWSQAVLRRIRNQKQRHPASFFKRIRDVGGSGAANSVKVIKRSTKEKKREVGFVNVGQEKRLRKVVPGGKGMDICSLLDETAHYIKCLTTQVKVMKRIAEISSTT